MRSSLQSPATEDRAKAESGASLPRKGNAQLLFWGDITAKKQKGSER